MKLAPVNDGFSRFESEELWKMCYLGNYDRCVELIVAGAEVQQGDTNKRTPLWISSYRGNMISNMMQMQTINLNLHY